jgi:hypothetical protein
MIPIGKPAVSSKDKFQLGYVIATPGALDTFSSGFIAECVIRHRQGDWGNLDAEDKKTNDDALESGGRLLSMYQNTQNEQRLYVITEAADESGHRLTTTALLPNEY